MSVPIFSAATAKEMMKKNSSRHQQHTQEYMKFFFPSPAAAELEDTGSPGTESVKRVDYATGRESSRFNQ